MKSLTVLAAMVLVALVTPGCDSGGGSGSSGDSCLDPGMVTFGAEQGADLCTGEVVTGTYKTDLWAVEDGGKLSFMTGGETPTHPRPVNWFKPPGGFQTSFDSLADVPLEYPDDGEDGLTLLKAKKHGGFLLLRADGSWVKGWFASLSSTSVTVQFGPAVEDAGTSNP